MIEFTKRVLKGSSVGRRVYPVCHACYRLYSVPHKQRLLRQHGYDALQRIHEALSTASISYFVDYGTLLGLVRDHALIPHDADMDIAIPPSVTTLYEVYSALRGHGFAFNRAFEYDGQIVSINTTYKGLPVDFFKYYRSDCPEEMFCYSFYWDEKRAYRDVSENSARYANLPCVSECLAERIHGVDVCVPDNVEAILAAEYGRQWRIPDAKWQEENSPTLHECTEIGRAVDWARVEQLDRVPAKEQ